MTQPRLAVLAGDGPLPGRIVAACRETGRDVFVVAHEGITDADGVGTAPHVWVRLGAIERTIALLHENRTEEVVLAGPVPRPSFTNLGLDRRALKALAGWRTKALGDDKLLSLIIAELEGEGFRVVGMHDILAGIVAPHGPLGAHAPDEEAMADIATGCRVARAVGALDVGQAVVAQQGMVLGVEAIEGTDALLLRCSALRREGPGGVLVKIRKPGQEARADLPTIGPATVERTRAAGLKGIAVEAGGTLIIDSAAAAAAADAAGLFVFGFAPDDL